MLKKINMILFFSDRCSHWPQAPCVAKDKLKLLIHLPPPSEYRGFTKPGFWDIRDQVQGSVHARQAVYQLSCISSMPSFFKLNYTLFIECLCMWVCITMVCGGQRAVFKSGVSPSAIRSQVLNLAAGASTY